MFVTVLNSPAGTEAVNQTYYTSEPLVYEETFSRESEIWKLCCPLFARVTQFQYGIKNVDNTAGRFLLSFTFDNGVNRENEITPVYLLPGQEETLTVDSPLRGSSVVTPSVKPQEKRVARQRIVEKEYTFFDKLWQFRYLPFRR